MRERVTVHRELVRGPPPALAVTGGHSKYGVGPNGVCNSKRFWKE